MKRGLVLEGGGAKGAYHMGVYKALVDEGVEINGVTGTSIGALNGAMIAQGDYKKCIELWKELSIDMVVNVSEEELKELENIKLDLDNIVSLGESIGQIISNKGLDITPLKNLIINNIDEEKLRKSKIDFGLVTVNLTKREALELFKEDINYGDMTKYILASAYLPSFRSEKLNGNVFIDGAFYDNLPFSMLIEKGYDEIILVRTHALGLIKDIEKTNKDIKYLQIEPSQDLGKMHDFNKDLALRNIKLGYYDCLKALRKYKGEIYTFLDNKSESYYLNYFLSLSDKKIDELMQLFNIGKLSKKRGLLEIIIPRISENLGLKKEGSYEDIFIKLLEKYAYFLNIDELNLYSIDELIKEVSSKHRIEQKSKKEFLFANRIINKIFTTDEIILQVGDIIFSED